MTREAIELEFTEGDLRSKGGVEIVLNWYKKDPTLRKHIFDFVFSNDRLAAMRAMDAYEKISSETGVPKSEAKKLLDIICLPKPKEYMWHYVQILGHMDITHGMREEVFNYLRTAVNTYFDSNIVRVFAMQSLYDLFIDDEKYGQKVLNTICEMTESPIPSLRTRAKRLLMEYNKGR